MFSKEIFSKHFTELRKSNKLNQIQLARILNITQAAVSKIEKGERACSIEMLYFLADYFDVSIDYLVGRTDNPHSHKL